MAAMEATASKPTRAAPLKSRLERDVDDIFA